MTSSTSRRASRARRGCAAAAAATPASPSSTTTATAGTPTRSAARSRSPGRSPPARDDELRVLHRQHPGRGVRRQRPAAAADAVAHGRPGRLLRAAEAAGRLEHRRHGERVLLVRRPPDRRRQPAASRRRTTRRRPTRRRAAPGRPARPTTAGSHGHLRRHDLPLPAEPHRPAGLGAVEHPGAVAGPVGGTSRPARPPRTRRAGRRIQERHDETSRRRARGPAAARRVRHPVHRPTGGAESAPPLPGNFNDTDVMFLQMMVPQPRAGRRDGAPGRAAGHRRPTCATSPPRSRPRSRTSSPT